MKDYILGIIFLVSIVLFSCSDKLDLTPANSITDEQIKELLESGDPQKIDLVLGSMANTMPDLFNASGLSGAGTADGRYRSIQGMNAMRNLEGNDIVFGEKILNIFGADEYLLRDFISPSVDKNEYYWNHMWSVINSANKMLNNLRDDKMVSTSPKLMDYKARGLVVRAYAYSYLMENYQDSYLLGGKEKKGLMLYDYYSPTQEHKPRSSSTETYTFIKNDLEQAIDLLEKSGVGYTSTTKDIDLAVAKFILARVSLITGEWETAISACNDILDHYPALMSQEVYGGKNTGTQDQPEIRPEPNGFLNNNVNPEVILGWPVGEALTAHNSWMNPFGEGNGGLGEGFARIDNRLYEQIDEKDFRKDCFMKESFGDYSYPTTGARKNIPAYTNLKFAATHGLGSDDRIQVGRVTCYYMRSSEVLLMKAEAQARGGKESDAKNTLNILLGARTKDGETPLTCDTYSSMKNMSVLEMVQFQTRIELWGEEGREFFNNKRWNIPVNRTTSDNHVDKSTYPVEKMTLKIPLSEILYNQAGCEQNQ